MKQLFTVAITIVVLLVGGGIVANHILTGGSKAVSLSTDPLYTPVTQALQQAYGNEQYTPIENIDYKIRASKYFDNNAWAVVSTMPIGTSSDALTMVLKKSGGTYQVALGPTNDLKSSNLSGLPNDVVRYLQGQ